MHFHDFSLARSIQDAVQQCGFTSPTPIQAKAIPPLLAGRDLLGLAQTGTGKTAAFVLPIVHKLLAQRKAQTQVLILAPTRELAEQINAFIITIIKKTSLRSIALYGGVSKAGQVARLRKGVNIVVACPGRLLDLLSDRALSLRGINTLVLDEADHMFDKGFLPDIRRILKQLPQERQTMLFSATMPGEIRGLAEEILTDPLEVRIAEGKSTSKVSHYMYPVAQERKSALLLHLLEVEAKARTLVFVRTRHKAKSLEQQLEHSGVAAASLQGNLSQNQRSRVLSDFRNGTVRVLVATDIAARGLDVAGIEHVINYDLPDTSEAYVHRTGRTGRAACSGEAFSFATGTENRMVQMIERSLQIDMTCRMLTDFSDSKIRSKSGSRMPGKKIFTTGWQGSGENRKASSEGRKFSSTTRKSHAEERDTPAAGRKYKRGPVAKNRQR